MLQRYKGFWDSAGQVLSVVAGGGEDDPLLSGVILVFISPTQSSCDSLKGDNTVDKAGGGLPMCYIFLFYNIIMKC